jgi:hypothetical protein
MAVVNLETPGSWTDAFAAADFNALANGSGLLSTATAVSNGSSLDLYADLSWICVTSTFTPTAGGHLAFYLLPLLHDGSSYPSATSSATAAAQAQITYLVGTIALGASAQSHKGIITGIRIPPGTFKWYMVNRSGAALPSSSTNMTCQYRLSSETVA